MLKTILWDKTTPLRAKVLKRLLIRVRKLLIYDVPHAVRHHIDPFFEKVIYFNMELFWLLKGFQRNHLVTRVLLILILGISTNFLSFELLNEGLK